MTFGTNKTPAEVIKEEEFGRTYFRDIYSGINGKWYTQSRKKFDELKNVYKKYYCSNIMTLASINIKLNVELHQDSGKIKDGLILQILMDGWSQWYFKYWLDRKSLDDKRKIARKMILWKGLKANLLK